jgi:hypothetical protein
MADEKKARADTSKTARTTIAKLSVDERKRVQAAVQEALDSHNLPAFQAALLRLGYAETSADYEKLMQLWEDFAQASRHG